MAHKSAAQRVLVHLKTHHDDVPARLGLFSECIIGTLNPQRPGSNAVDAREMRVKCYLHENTLVLEKTDCAELGVKLKHLNLCPMKIMEQSDVEALPFDITSRGINVGVVTLLESSDAHVLVTRRAPHMRTFPGVWVPPGGGIDWDESLSQAGLRELGEETGLLVESEILSENVLCLWESVFPPLFSLGPPKRHHIVVYLHVQVKSSMRDLAHRVRLHPDEVDACSWLSQDHVDLVVNGFEADSIPRDAPKTFQLTVLEEGVHTDVDCPVEALTAKVPPKGVDVERISSGTRYALEQWLMRKNSPGTSSKL